MPRIARIVAIGHPHHITQSGNYKQKVFLDDNDRTKYLSWIQTYSEKYGLSILAYCLMSNHVHFIAIPQKEDSLAKVFNAAHMCYAQYYNNLTKTRGHLWQGRFYSCVLDENHLMAAGRYVEMNPVRAKIVKKPWEWKWSSAIAHIGKAKPMIKLGNLFDYVDMSSESWKKYIDAEEDEKAIVSLRSCTVKGRVFGDAEFIGKLDKRFKDRLAVLPRGRPWPTK